MNRTAAALFAAAFVLGAAASAQAPAKTPSTGGIPVTVTTFGPDGQTRTTTVVISPVGGCPVAMRAKQGGTTQMIKTGQKPPETQPYEPMPKPSQHIHLILWGFAKNKRVASAVITARGLSARGRIDRAASGSSSELRRTMTVTFTPDDDGTISAYVDLPAFTSVSSLQLESITYSDGSDWKLPDQHMCRVTPDPVMLVAGN